MNHGQRFKPTDPTQQQEDSPFEFKPLDLSAITGAGPKRKKRVTVPCHECGVPGCPFERVAEVDE